MFGVRTGDGRVENEGLEVDVDVGAALLGRNGSTEDDGKGIGSDDRPEA